jgi:hypothetical protein
VTALFRYTLATMLHSQRYLAPVLLFVGAVAVVSSNDSGPLAPTYALCGAILLICSTWLTIALISVDDPVHRAITVVNAGRSHTVLLASIAVALAGSLVLTAFGLVFPLVVGSHEFTAADTLLGFEAHLTCAAAGIAIGLICSRLVIRRQGYALVVAIGLVAAILLVPGLPPVHVLFQKMANARRAADLVAPAAGYTAMAIAVLVVSAIATQFVTTRRD